MPPVPGSAVERRGWPLLRCMVGLLFYALGIFPCSRNLQDQGLEILEELGVASETQQKMSEEKWEGSPMLFSSSDSAQPTKAHVTTLAAELLESALALEAFQCRLRGPSSAPSFLRLDEMNQRLGRLHGGAFPLHFLYVSSQSGAHCQPGPTSAACRVSGLERATSSKQTPSFFLQMRQLNLASF